MTPAYEGTQRMDFLGPHGGELAGAFASGCVAAWGFVQLILVGPLKRRIVELKEDCEARERKMEARIDYLERMLFSTGPFRNQVQAAISEIRVTGGE